MRPKYDLCVNVWDSFFELVKQLLLICCFSFEFTFFFATKLKLITEEIYTKKSVIFPFFWQYIY